MRGESRKGSTSPSDTTPAGIYAGGGLAAGKDQRCQAKYFLAAVYTYPTDGQGRSLGAERPDEAEHEAEDREEMDIDMLEEKEEGERVPEKEAEKEIKAADIWETKIEEAHDVAVTILTFVEPIEVSDVLPAIARVYAKRVCQCIGCTRVGPES